MPLVSLSHTALGDLRGTCQVVSMDTFRPMQGRVRSQLNQLEKSEPITHLGLVSKQNILPWLIICTLKWLVLFRRRVSSMVSLVMRTTVIFLLLIGRSRARSPSMWSKNCTPSAKLSALAKAIKHGMDEIRRASSASSKVLYSCFKVLK